MKKKTFHGMAVHLEVVKDVADEGHKTNPLLSGPPPRLLSGVKLLLQTGQQVTAK